MKLNIEDLRTSRQWRSATGLSQKQFNNLLIHFSSSYQEIQNQTIEERNNKAPFVPAITQYNELLLFVLFSFKSDLTYDLLGFVSGMDGSTAKRNQTLGIEILQHCLLKIGSLPKRNFENEAQFKEYFQEHLELIVDATEQPIQRPKDKALQKEYYSGKKKAHS